MNHHAECKLFSKPKVRKRVEPPQGSLSRLGAPIPETATMPQDRIAKRRARAKAALRATAALPRHAGKTALCTYAVDDDSFAAARLISKHEVLDRVGVTYPTLWSWMRRGAFPRSRELGGKVCWLESEIEDWIVNRPVRRLKGDKAEVA